MCGFDVSYYLQKKDSERICINKQDMIYFLVLNFNQYNPQKEK
jgi:hypothetical protein